MLRQAVVRCLSRSSAVSTTRRSLAASAASKDVTGAKRALNQEQLKGTEKAAPPSATPPPPPSGDGGSSMMPLAIAGLVGAGGFGYYMFGMDQAEAPKEEEDKARAAPSKEEGEEKEEAQVVESVVEGQKEAEEETKADSEEEGEKTAVTKEDTTPEEGESGNRVLQIDVPDSSERQAPEVRIINSAPSGGNRVTMEPEYKRAAAQAAKEFENSETLQRAHHVFSSPSPVSDTELDQMTEAQLRIKIIQLATEMQERTKWEAVRLKEFLALKEQETADK